jgi:hypothetical protein
MGVRIGLAVATAAVARRLDGAREGGAIKL